MRMGKNRQQLVLEEYQDSVTEIIRIDATDPDMDMGTLPGCLGFHNQPVQGYVCSSCYHQKLCRETTTSAFSGAGGFDVKTPTSQRTMSGKNQTPTDSRPPGINS